MKDSSSVRLRHCQLRKRAGDLSVRDESFQAIHDLLVHGTEYEFNPEVYLSDAAIPKGGILQAIRDVS